MPTGSMTMTYTHNPPFAHEPAYMAGVTTMASEVPVNVGPPSSDNTGQRDIPNGGPWAEISGDFADTKPTEMKTTGGDCMDDETLPEHSRRAETPPQPTDPELKRSKACGTCRSVSHP